MPIVTVRAARPRDNQRKRLYEAEKIAAAAMAVDHWGQTIFNDELQAWVDKVLDTRSIRSRWGKRRIKVYLTHGGARGGGGSIRLGVATRNPAIILHEIAHCLSPENVAHHGPEFAGIYLFLVKTIIGPKSADALRAAFRTKRVRTSNEAIPAANSHPTPAKAVAVSVAREQADRPVTPSEARQAASVLRRAVSQGLLGSTGTKPRIYALSAARTLDKL